jgi:hypothetical protein
MLRSEEATEMLSDFQQRSRELRSTVIDHVTRERLANLGG